MSTTNAFAPGYSHAQKAPLCLLVYLAALVMWVSAWSSREVPAVTVILGVSGAVMVVLAMSFHYLRVVDQGESLGIQFGPLPFFRRSVRYEDIEKVEKGRTTLLDGWGIHYSIRGGWVWNIWGRDCVSVHLKKGKLFLGTDDPDNLIQFLEGQITRARTQEQGTKESEEK